MYSLSAIACFAWLSFRYVQVEAAAALEHRRGAVIELATTGVVSIISCPTEVTTATSSSTSSTSILASSASSFTPIVLLPTSNTPISSTHATVLYSNTSTSTEISSSQSAKAAPPLLLPPILVEPTVSSSASTSLITSASTGHSSIVSSSTIPPVDVGLLIPIEMAATATSPIVPVEGGALIPIGIATIPTSSMTSSNAGTAGESVANFVLIPLSGHADTSTSFVSIITTESPLAFILPPVLETSSATKTSPAATSTATNSIGNIPQNDPIPVSNGSLPLSVSPSASVSNLSVNTPSSIITSTSGFANISSSAAAAALNIDATPTAKDGLAFLPLPPMPPVPKVTSSSKQSSGNGSTPWPSSTTNNALINVGQNLSSTIYWGNSSATTSSTSCSSVTPGGTWTNWIFVANTTTLTDTTTLGVPATFTSTPEFNPPSQCSNSASALSSPAQVSPTTSNSDTTVSSLLYTPKLTPVNISFKQTLLTATVTTVTAIITSKNGITVTSTVTPPSYDGGTIDLKVSAEPATSTEVSITPKQTVIIPLTTSPPALDYITSVNNVVVGSGPDNTAANSGNAVSTAQAITSLANNGVTVIVSPTEVVIGGQSVSIGSSTTVLTQNGAEYTIDASQIIGPAVSIIVPTTTAAAFGLIVANPTTAAPVNTASNTIILDGEPFSAIGSSIVVLGSSTITYGAGIATTTAFVNGESITIGPSGVSFGGTTYGGTANPTGTQIGLVGGLSITEVGSTLAVVDGSTLTIGPSATPITATISGHTVTAGSSGLDLGGTVLEYPFNPTSTLSADGLSITELGSSLAIINGYTLTIGPNVTPTTAVILGHTITADSSGLALDGTTLEYPFNPTTTSVTAGGITFQEIGATIAVIGGTTYNIGPSATPTTEVLAGQVISIGPSGIGFSSTTFVQSKSPSTSASGTLTETGTGTAASSSHTTKKSGVERVIPSLWVGSLAVCILYWMGQVL